MLYQPVAPTGKRVCPAPNTAPVSGLLVMRDKVSYTTITCSPLLSRLHGSEGEGSVPTVAQ